MSDIPCILITSITLEPLVVVEELRLVLEPHGRLPDVRLHRVHGDGGALLEDGAAQRGRESAKSEVDSLLGRVHATLGTCF